MSSYNEEDIIQESISKLIQQGIDVLLIDNGSTDSTVEKAEIFINEGLIKIDQCVFYESNIEVYDWSKILERKQDWAKQLDYDWYIHVDADEIRYSPWKGVPLSEGVRIVDNMGYNLINFRLFNFKLNSNEVEDISVEDSLKFYVGTESFNRMQLKAWKRDSEIDLVTHGGHRALIRNPKIFPIRFIHKHYPIRSLEQGKQKIFKDRLSRYSIIDRQKGWHVQYDHFNIPEVNVEKLMLGKKQDLILYNHDNILNELFLESLQIINIQSEIIAGIHFNDEQEEFYVQSKIVEKFDKELVEEIKIIAKYTENLIRRSEVIDAQIIDNYDLKKVIFELLKKQALNEYLNGDPMLWDGLNILL